MKLASVLIRLFVSIIYLATKSYYIIPVIKSLQVINIYLMRDYFCAVPLLVELLAEVCLTLRKEKRRINFDSRLENKYFGTKVFAVYVLLFTTFLTPTEEIHKNPSAVLFTAFIYYVAASLDNIYSYRTKEILRSIALCPILLSIYFIFEPLVPTLNTFGLLAHTLISVFISVVFMLYALTSEYSYRNEILYKKMINL